MLQDQNVKLAAVKALNNALEFASRNFDVDTERNYILQVICEACTHGSDEVKEYAYQCLSRIAEVLSNVCAYRRHGIGN